MHSQVAGELGFKQEYVQVLPAQGFLLPGTLDQKEGQAGVRGSSTFRCCLWIASVSIEAGWVSACSRRALTASRAIW